MLQHAVLCEHEERGGNKPNIPLERGRKRGQTETKWDRERNRNTMKDSEREKWLAVTVTTRGRHRATLPAALQPAYRQKRLYTKMKHFHHECDTLTDQNKIQHLLKEKDDIEAAKYVRACKALREKQQHMPLCWALSWISFLLWLSPFLIRSNVKLCLISYLCYYYCYSFYHLSATTYFSLMIV